MDSGRGTSPWRLIRRIIDARRGDVRAMEDVYHLRGVLTFVLLFAATIVLPGLMLAYYGVAGIRADEMAGSAELQRKGTSTASELQRRVEQMFQSFEDATNNRLKSGQSATTGLGELTPELRVVFRFNDAGELASPFLRPTEASLAPQDMLLCAPWAEGEAAERQADYPRAAALYAQAAREAETNNARGQALFARARALQRADDLPMAESVYQDVLADYANERENHGFRLGDIARLRIGEILFRRSPDEGRPALVRLVDELTAADWTIGEGGEAAVARRAIEVLSTAADQNWLSRARSQIDDRSRQLYWAGRLLSEVDGLGAKGRLLRGDPGKFSYFTSANAVWAMTWTDREQYAFGMELDAIVTRVRTLAGVVGGPDSEIEAAILPPEGVAREDVLARTSLAPWLPGWSITTYPRDPDGLGRRRADERRQGLGIILLSVLMIVVGAGLSARLVQRELDAARDKSDFAAHVSHELRSPITQIRLKAEALQLGLATDEPSRARHYDVIVRESERLSRLVDNVLDFAAIERGRKKYTFRPGDLGLTVARTVEAAKVSMEMRAIDVELSLPDDLPVVWHDADAVAQVLHNLLSNAAKYGQEGKWIGVEVRVNEGAVEVDVSDRGIGINPAEQRQIFEQYYRSSDPNARRRKGTGIGLTIVKYIMEAHGGRVAVRSAPGKGSTFTLYFNATTPPAQAERAGA